MLLDSVDVEVNVVGVVRWLDKEVLVADVVGVANSLRVKRSSESEVSRSTVPVISVVSEGASSSGGTATSGASSASDGASSSSISCASSWSGMSVSPSKAQAVGRGWLWMMTKRRRLLRKNRRKNFAAAPGDAFMPRAATELRFLSSYRLMALNIA